MIGVAAVLTETAALAVAVDTSAVGVGDASRDGDPSGTDPRPCVLPTDAHPVPAHVPCLGSPASVNVAPPLILTRGPDVVTLVDPA